MNYPISVAAGTAWPSSECIINICNFQPVDGMSPSDEEGEKSKGRIRTCGNVIKVAGATIGSSLSAYISTFPSGNMILLGGGGSAIFNIASTYFACDDGTHETLVKLTHTTTFLERQLGLEPRSEQLTSNKVRLMRNFFKLSAAGAVTFIGATTIHPAIIAVTGKMPAIMVGAWIQAVGNGLSTYWFFDNGDCERLQHLIQRMCSIIDYLNTHGAIVEGSGSWEKVKIDLTTPSKISQFENCKSIGIASGLTGAGALCSLDPGILGYLTSIIGNGIGNGASTYFPFDNGIPSKIKQIQTLIMPLLQAAILNFCSVEFSLKRIDDAV